MKRKLFLIILGLMTSFLVGCGPVAGTQITTYQLQDVGQIRVANNVGSSTLLVMTPTASANYQSKNMLYSINQYQTQPFAKNQWVAPPAKMLAPLIITSLRNKNYFKAVVPAPFQGKADYLLTTQLTEFQQYFFNDSDRSYFKMSLLAVLNNNKTHKVIAERRFDATVNAPERSPYGGVIAANRATATILSQFSNWCVQQLRY